jgi:hypothetical protein
MRSVPPFSEKSVEILGIESTYGDHAVEACAISDAKNIHASLNMCFTAILTTTSRLFNVWAWSP